MLIDVQRERWLACPSRSFRVDPLSKEQRGVTTPQIVEPDARGLCALYGKMEITHTMEQNDGRRGANAVEPDMEAVWTPGTRSRS